MAILERFGVTCTWQNATIPAVQALAFEADNLGYGHFWIQEAWGLEALSTAGNLLSITKRIRIGTGILNIYSRSAALLGMSYVTFDQMAPGRFMLGLGSSGKALVEDWHGHKFERPLARTRDYINIIRKVAKGTPVDYEGETVKTRRFRLFTKPLPREPEIYIGAIGEQNLKLAGEVADGALLVTYPFSALRNAQKLLGGKKLFAWYPLRIVDSKEEEEKARLQVARNIAFYLASMGKYYAQNLSRLGYAEDVQRIASEAVKSGTQVAASTVSTKLLDELSLIGTAKSVQEKIEKRIPEEVFPVFVLSASSPEEAAEAVKSLGEFASVSG